MIEKSESKELLSLIAGAISLALTVIFIEDKALRIGVGVSIFIIIMFLFFLILLKEINQNSLEIKKMNERVKIYERLNKLEALLEIKGGNHEQKRKY